MRVTLEQSNLLKSLGHVYRVVERRNTIPILSNVLLRADGSELHLKATDLDLEMFEKTAANVDQAGATTVPAHMLYEIIRKLPSGSEVQLAIDEEASKLTIRSGRSNFTLRCCQLKTSQIFLLASFRIRSHVQLVSFASS